MKPMESMGKLTGLQKYCQYFLFTPLYTFFFFFVDCFFFCSPFVCASSFVQIKYKSFGRRGIFILASVSKKELYIKTKAKRKKNETKQNYLSFENR